jgi:hypothetical protein
MDDVGLAAFRCVTSTNDLTSRTLFTSFPDDAPDQGALPQILVDPELTND